MRDHSTRCHAHPDQKFWQYVVSSIREGFQIRFHYDRSCRSSSTHSMVSALERSQIIWDYLALEYSEGRVMGPLMDDFSQVHTSRFWGYTKGIER